MAKEDVISCPKCQEKMKILIISRPDGHIVIDQCEKCEGYWFDGLELEKIVTEEMASEFFLLDSSEVDEASFPCPRCKGHMETQLLFEVRVDKCLFCNGLWLDKGELREIQFRYVNSLNDSDLLQLIKDLLIESKATT